MSVIATEEILKDLKKVGILATRVTHFDHGSSRSTYKIEAGGNKLVLKLFDPAHHKSLQDEITLLYEVTKYYDSVHPPLQKKPIPVARRLACIYPFFDGHLFSKAKIKEKHFEFGKVVAEFDSALKHLPVNKNPTLSKNLLALPSPKCTSASLGRLTENAARLFNKEIALTDLNLIRQQYIHKDLHFDNVLYRSTSKKHLIIDTGGISIQFLPREIAVPIGNELLDSSGNFSPHNVRELVRGYSVTTRLTDNERKLIPLFIIQKKLGEIEHLCKQVLLANRDTETTELMKKYLTLSRESLTYVVKEYGRLRAFFAELK